MTGGVGSTTGGVEQQWEGCNNDKERENHDKEKWNHNERGIPKGEGHDNEGRGGTMKQERGQ